MPRERPVPPCRPPGEALAEEVEPERGEDDRHRRAYDDDRRDVDARESLGEHASPVVGGRLHTDSEQAETRQRKECVAHRQHQSQQQRLRHIRQHVTPHQPQPPEAEDTRCGDVIRAGHRGRERLAEARKVRRDRRRDPDHRASGPQADDRGDEDREQESRERHGEIDRARDQPAEPAPHQRRQDPDRDADAGAQQAGEHRQEHRQPGGHEGAVQDVAAEQVGAQRMGGRRSLRRCRDVDLGRSVRPERRPDQRQHKDRRDHQRSNDADGRPEQVGPAHEAAARHWSMIVDCGLITASSMSTTKLISRMKNPKMSATAWTEG